MKQNISNKKCIYEEKKMNKIIRSLFWPWWLRKLHHSNSFHNRLFQPNISVEDTYISAESYLLRLSFLFQAGAESHA